MKRGVFQPNKTRDITGQKFGSLTAVRFDHRDERTVGGQHYWLFRCDCGNEVVLRKNSVTSNNTTCCADCSRKRKALVNTKHGGVDTRLYREWAAGRLNVSVPYSVIAPKPEPKPEPPKPDDQFGKTEQLAGQTKLPDFDSVSIKFSNSANNTLHALIDALNRNADECAQLRKAIFGLLHSAGVEG